jgi:hypothetical protein
MTNTGKFQNFTLKKPPKLLPEEMLKDNLAQPPKKRALFQVLSQDHQDNKEKN